MLFDFDFNTFWASEVVPLNTYECELLFITIIHGTKIASMIKAMQLNQKIFQ